jgi:hypothetical protein
MATAARIQARPGRPAAAVLAPAVDLSILIVNYNTQDLLRQCLRSIYDVNPGMSFEVVVVDNASSDRSAEMVKREFPDAVLIRNTRNEGFSVANNIAMKASRGKYVLLLNSDTIVVPGTLGRMVSFLEGNPDVGVAGCRLVRPSGELDFACRRSFPTPMVSLTRLLRLNRIFPGSRFFGRYNLTFLDEKENYEVDSIVGAFMLARRRVFEEVGGLDEDYFMYGEDVDWCYRIKQARWKVAYLGDSHVVHYKGAISRKESFRMNYHFHRAMYLFHTKHLSARYPFVLNQVVYFGIFCRFALLAINHLVRVPLRWLAPSSWMGDRYACRCEMLADATVPESSLKS